VVVPIRRTYHLLVLPDKAQVRRMRSTIDSSDAQHDWLIRGKDLKAPKLCPLCYVRQLSNLLRI
jgi:hypothetical protein